MNWIIFFYDNLNVLTWESNMMSNQCVKRFPKTYQNSFIRSHDITMTSSTTSYNEYFKRKQNKKYIILLSKTFNPTAIWSDKLNFDLSLSKASFWSIYRLSICIVLIYRRSSSNERDQTSEWNKKIHLYQKPKLSWG